MSGVESHLEELRDWIRRERVQAYDVAEIGAGPEEYNFLPDTVVKRYFQEDHCRRTRRLLHETFHTRNLPVDEKTVAERCPRVFCILALLGKQSLIQSFVKHQSLWDQRLPYEPGAPPRHFPRDSTDDGFYDKFITAQYPFCAQILERCSGIRIENEIILPFVKLEANSVGGSATVYRALVQPTHDKLTDSSSSHCYAVKTYRKRRAEADYEREAEAFRQITESGTRATPGMIEFYGGFEYKKSFNIILEYADGGTLEDYFSLASPSSGQDAFEFYKNLFETIKAIFRIHEHHLDTEESGSKLLLQGWHQDLKPANILVVRRDEGHHFRWAFKVADLGLSHFKTIMEGQPEATGQDRFGTRTYGAPETYAPSSFTEIRKNKVKRSIDIWSLGAVYSEAAVWVVKGRGGLTEYRQRRKSATSRIPNFRVDDCFHDGERRLPVVSKQHEELQPEHSSLHDRESGGQNAYVVRRITTYVLENMVEEMMHDSPGSRPSAEQLDSKAEKALERAQTWLSQPLTVPTRAPISSPPTTNSSPELHHRADSGPSSELPQFFREQSSLVRSPQGTIVDANSGRLAHDGLNGLRLLSLDHVHARSSSQRHNLPGELSSSAMDHDGCGEGSRQAPVPAQRLSRHDNVYNQYPRSTAVPTFEADNVEDPLSRLSSTTNANDLVRGPDINPYIEAETHEQSTTPPATPEQSSTNNRHATKPEQRNNRRPQQYRRRSIPYLSLTRTREWYYKKKAHQPAQLPDDWLLGRLNGRDQVIIIDDSESMRLHWKTTVVELAKLLTYMLKTVDPDGVDLLFLSSTKIHKVKTSTDLETAVKNHVPWGRTSLNGCFDDHLRDYGRRIDSYANPSLFSRTRPPVKRNIYIITDGVLRHGDQMQGHSSIQLLVQKLYNAGLGRDQIGIQFIRIGNDSDGKRRLDNLDHLRRSAGLHLDIVDTEPCDGNVWKMLHGAINELFDDDEDGESAAYSPLSS